MLRDDPRYLQFSNKRLLKLIFPIFVEQAVIVAVSFVDAVMLSSIHENAFAAISLVDMINLLLMQVFMAISAGGAIVAAQFLGKRDRKAALDIASTTAVLVLLVSVSLGAITTIFSRSMLRLIYPSVGSDTLRYATEFLVLSAISYPLHALYSCGSSLLYAQANSRSSMIASLIMNSLKVLLNLLFILVLRLGVIGIGLSTLLSRLAGAAMVTHFMMNREAPLHYKGPFTLRMLHRIDKRIFHVALPSGMENFLFLLGKLVIGTLIAGLSGAAIAANAASNTLSTAINVPGNAINLATVTVVGQCVGAGLLAEAEYNAKRLLKLHYVAQGVMGLALFLLARPLTNLLSLSREATDLAVLILVVYGPLSFFFEPSAFGLPNSLRASGDNRFTMFASIFSMLVFRVGFSYLLVYGFGLGLRGIWYAMYLDWIARSIFFALRFRGGQWKKHSLV